MNVKELCRRENNSNNEEDSGGICLSRIKTSPLPSLSAPTPGYRRPFCMAWTQLPLGKASGERGPAHRTHAHG